MCLTRPYDKEWRPFASGSPMHSRRPSESSSWCWATLALVRPRCCKRCGSSSRHTPSLARGTYSTRGWCRTLAPVAPRIERHYSSLTRATRHNRSTVRHRRSPRHRQQQVRSMDRKSGAKSLTLNRPLASSFMGRMTGRRDSTTRARYASRSLTLLAKSTTPRRISTFCRRATPSTLWQSM